MRANIAGALKARFPALVEAEPESMARHCREAGSFAEAIEFLQLAAQRAMASFAHIDAVAHLKAALALAQRCVSRREPRKAAPWALLGRLARPAPVTAPAAGTSGDHADSPWQSKQCCRNAQAMLAIDAGR